MRPFAPWSQMTAHSYVQGGPQCREGVRIHYFDCYHYCNDYYYYYYNHYYYYYFFYYYYYDYYW